MGSTPSSPSSAYLLAWECKGLCDSNKNCDGLEPTYIREKIDKPGNESAPCRHLRRPLLELLLPRVDSDRGVLQHHFGILMIRTLPV
ncbi:hypothetical protein TcasGA2_TC034035 [Tribolium castaneum]|uniref:Uncharacterized protein n=1 Tax=Tribolium castaneum TaxID=7070 RepID=A0A139WDM7_TRICA|nr:hypothetical protein TcasGA2_TC034035 [Tribolium castaneum]